MNIVDAKRIVIEDSLSTMPTHAHFRKDKSLPGAIQSMGHLDFGGYLFQRLVRDSIRPQQDAVDQVDLDVLAGLQRDSTSIAASAARDRLMDQLRQAVGPNIPV
jgi:hypothetical protein